MTIRTNNRQGNERLRGLFSKAACIAGMAFYTVTAHAGPILVSYTVEAAFGAAPTSTANATDLITGSDGDTLTLTYVPQEPVPPSVSVPTNTAWGSLYLDVSALPGSGVESYSLAGAVLYEEVIDSSTGQEALDIGTFTGTVTVNSLEQPSSSGLITWSIGSATQYLPSPSVVFITTDASDSVGTKLDGDTGSPAFLSAATTVNGTINATSPIPEPATLSLIGGGLLGLGVLRRKRVSR